MSGEGDGVDVVDERQDTGARAVVRAVIWENGEDMEFMGYAEGTVSQAIDRFCESGSPGARQGVWHAIPVRTWQGASEWRYGPITTV